MKLSTRKNLNDKQAALEIIARVSKLNADSKPRWGSMKVCEMLHHCNILNKLNMEGKRDRRPTSVKQRLMKLLVLYITPRFPKNVKSPSRTIPHIPLLPACRFEEEKRKFTETITAFTEKRSSIKVMHPVLGKLSRKEWGMFTWMHMDHHLRQFGV